MKPIKYISQYKSVMNLLYSVFGSEFKRDKKGNLIKGNNKKKLLILK